jgi:acetyltransferase-like isoleucine patch superfamily enzyme
MTGRNVVIIGNSGAARECWWVLDAMLQSDAAAWDGHRFKGFVSWGGYAGDLCELGPFLGTDDEYRPERDDRLIIGIGSPKLRRAVYEHYKKCGAAFINLRHPWSEVCPSAVIGEAHIFQRDSTVYCNARVGSANYCNGAVNIAHDAEVGDCNFFGPYTMILGGARVGSDNRFGPRCIVLDKARVGNNNTVAPAGVIYKGCGDNRMMAGNPALDVS